MDETNQIEFRLSGNPAAGVVTIVLLATGGVGIAIIAAEVATGQVVAQAALFGAILLLALPMVLPVSVRAAGQGVVRLTRDGLVVHMRLGRQQYLWDDIADIQLEERERAPGGIDMRSTKGVVRIALKRSLRLGLVPGRFGTAVIGIPAPSAKSVRLQVDNPEGLVSTVQALLRTSNFR